MTGGNHQGGNRAARLVLEEEIPLMPETFKTCEVLERVKKSFPCRYFSAKRVTALIRERDDIEKIGEKSWRKIAGRNNVLE